MYCSRCGCKNDEGVKYCRECGKKLIDSESSSEEKSALPVYIISSLLIIALLGGMIYWAVLFVKEHRISAKRNLEYALEADADGEKKDKSKQDSTEPITDDTDNVAEKEEKTPKDEETENDITEEEKQKDLFRRFNKYLNNTDYVGGEYFCCNFAYIDDDNIPELIMDISGDGRSDKLLCLKKGKVYESDIWAPGTISYKEKENLIINDSNYWSADEDGTIFEVARIKKGKYFVDEQLHEINYRDNEGNVEHTEIKINSNYVSKDDYDEETEKYRNLDGLEVFDFKYDTIKKAFKNLEKYPIDTSLLYNEKQLEKKGGGKVV